MLYLKSALADPVLQAARHERSTIVLFVRESKNLVSRSRRLESLDQPGNVLKRNAESYQPACGIADSRVQVKRPDDAHGVHQPASDNHSTQCSNCFQQFAHLTIPLLCASCALALKMTCTSNGRVFLAQLSNSLMR
jgi:hypothetical protein